MSTSSLRFARSGSLAGAVSTFTFIIIHDVFISDIWFSLPIMLIAGALCGACVGGSYWILVRRPSLPGWIGYNGVYVLLLCGLGIASVAAFEPVTTIAALIAANGPPDRLIREALPMTFLFTVIGATVIGIVYRQDRAGFAAALIASIVVVLFLGLNISVIGLIEVPLGSLYLIAELFGLILVLNLAYVTVFVWLERESLRV